MLKYIRNKATSSRMERGQVLLMVAFAIIGIIAAIGLAIDGGLMFIADARLRRAVDAAALASALQYREGVVDLQGTLRTAAVEYLVLNGFELDPSQVLVETCTQNPSLCYDSSSGTTILRKLVHVRATATVHLAFLPVIGINTVDISADATGESASLDLVLVIDTSESMTFDAPRPGATLANGTILPQGDPLRDPSICNHDDNVNAVAAALGWGSTDPYSGINIDTNDGIPGECHPFEEVKTAAINFVNNLFVPYDRVTIVNFDKTAKTVLDFAHNCDTSLYGAQCASTDPAVLATPIHNTITTAIENLQVTEGEGICPTGQPCRPYCTLANIENHECDDTWQDATQGPPAPTWITPDQSKPYDPNAVYAGNFDCGDGYLINAQPPMDPSQCTTTNIAGGLSTAGYDFSIQTRSSSLWVVILLTDGAANAAIYGTPPTVACPDSTWDPFRSVPDGQPPLCRDWSAETRHCLSGSMVSTCINNGDGNGHIGQVDPINYDADDAAHDAADYVGLIQKAIVFSIGLGPLVHQSDDAGGKLLKYAAEYVSDGSYYDAPTSADLSAIFKKIGEKIATRLAR